MRGLMLVLLILFTTASNACAQGGLAENGRSLVVRMCAQCHAIDAAEDSQVPSAPAFRRLEPRVDLEELQKRLQDGILAGHPEMPVFILKANEAHAVVAYLKSIRAD